MNRLRAFAAVSVALAAAVAAADERGYQLVNGAAASGVTKKPAPLVVVLHCLGCAPTWLPEQWRIEALAKKYGFVAAIPSGMRDHEGTLFWNATPACCDFDGKNPDDVGYLIGIIDELVKKGVADPKRIYLAGFSNGGFMAYRLACEHGDKIAAIVSVGGAAPETCKPAVPVSVLDVHGTADKRVPLDGWPPRVPPARETLAKFAAVDKCTTGGKDVWRCPHNAVELWVREGAHVPVFGDDFGERLWQWLAAQHK
jgi:polyhydroxybutyrate depolymerase